MKNERRIEYVALSKLKKAKRNPKQHDIETLGESVERFGYVEPLVMDERTGRLVAGHGRLELLLKLQKDGAALPPGVKNGGKDWQVPVVRGWASKNDKEADAYLLASNRLVEIGGWDDAALNRMLRELGVDGLSGVGYASSKVKHLLDESAVTDDLPKNVFQVLVDVQSEKEQASLMRKLERDGYVCRPLLF